MFNPTPEAVAAVARGEIVVVAGDEGRQNEGDLILAAGPATAEAAAFFVREGGGLLCVAIPGSRADEAASPLMVTANPDGLEVVDQVPLESRPTEDNIGYLRTKRDRLGHHLATLDDASSRWSLLGGPPDTRQNRHTRQRSKQIHATSF